MRFKTFSYTFFGCMLVVFLFFSVGIRDAEISINEERILLNEALRRREEWSRGRLQQFLREEMEAKNKDPKGEDTANTIEYEERDLLVIFTFSMKAKQNPLENVQFFLRHGLHDAADFLFVDNGGGLKDVVKFPVHLENVFYWAKVDLCYDLGNWKRGIDYMMFTHDKIYRRFIFMNGSVRGPFIAPWNNGCWSDIFAGTNLFTAGKPKLIGTTFNCMNGTTRHVQSQLLATNYEGYELTDPTMLDCPSDYNYAIQEEINISQMFLKANVSDPFMVTAANSWEENYFATCNYGDYWSENQYYGGSVKPHELVFIKTNRNITNAIIDLYSKFMDESSYSSYDHCKRKPKIKMV